MGKMSRRGFYIRYIKINYILLNSLSDLLRIDVLTQKNAVIALLQMCELFKVENCTWSILWDVKYLTVSFVLHIIF